MYISRESNPEARSFSWEGTTGSVRRKYSQESIVYIQQGKRGKPQMNTNNQITCGVSDHDGIAVNVGNASVPDIGKGEQN